MLFFQGASANGRWGNGLRRSLFGPIEPYWQGPGQAQPCLAQLPLFASDSRRSGAGFPVPLPEGVQIQIPTTNLGYLPGTFQAFLWGGHQLGSKKRNQHKATRAGFFQPVPSPELHLQRGAP